MISILMPIYNGIEFINDSVNSVLGQTYQNWELIIAVNGHPKNSNIYKIAKQYANHKIRVLDLFNLSGKSATLNAMLKYCTFDNIALLDVDDIWNETKLTIQSNFLNKYDVIGSNCIWFGERPGVIPKIPTGDISQFNFKQVNPIINSSAIIKKELCFWNDTQVEDYDLWLRLRNDNKTFYNCTEILVLHRIHSDSFFNSKNNHKAAIELLRTL
jgi:teichuronic acid biosynthesis glycosyltransferase TuaG